jgi:urea transport system substrate-binding protein
MSATDPSETAEDGGKPHRETPRSMLRSPFPFLEPPLRPDEIGRLGDYRVIRSLGSGGMGLVFEAEDTSLHRRVALKVLRPELAADADHRERFLREARAAAAINSDHVITIYQISESMPPYFAMQFLEGESLDTRLEGTERITLRSALEIARQTAEGLAAAHERGLTHRDIKPANLWLEAKPVAGKPDAGKPGILRPQSTTTRVRILDFGLARRSADPSLTSTGFVVGTPHFMSPEQASGLPVDGRSDLFSLGCVMYMMLTGELPFPGKTTMAVMTALATKTPAPVHEKNPSVPRTVSDLIARMLEKDPSVRSQSARQIVEVLEEVLSDLSGTTTLPNPRAATKGVTQAVGETPLVGETERVAVSTEAIAPPVPRRRVPWAVWAGLTVLLGLVAFLSYRELRNAFSPGSELEPIVVGILHSQSGTMAVSEAPVVDATILAIEEINASGGVLGLRLKAVIVDGKSNADVFAAGAERLLDEEKAVVVFGCWTSASRKAVRDVLQRRPDGLLFYPVQYEGLERSPRIIYLGAAPNQQLLPAVDYLTRPVAAGGLGKKRLYHVGSDYVFPRAAHEIIKDQIRLKKEVELVGETFIPFGSPAVSGAANQIKALKADAVISTINGSTNVAFFRELRKAGVIAAEVPTLSVSITENEISGLNPVRLAGDYIAASYFQSIDRPESREFLRKLGERFPNRVGSDAAAAAYSAVHLWAKAVARAGTTDPSAVHEACRGLEFEGPRARITIDPETLHAWLPVRIGRIRADGQIDLVAEAGSERPIAPVLFPPTRSEAQWGQFLHGLTAAWEGKWQPSERK